MRCLWPIVRHEFKLLADDQVMVTLLFAMPVVLLIFTRRMFQIVLEGTGLVDSSGAEQAVPGLATMFAFFLVAFVGLQYFRELAWGTWDRLRAAPVRPIEIAAGKAIAPICVAVVQQVTIFATGFLFFGLRSRGPVLALVPVSLALAVCLVALGTVVAAFSRTVQQVAGFANLGALAFGCVGGALVPRMALPGWAQPLSPFTPTYWAMRGFQNVILDGGGLAGVAVPVAVLLGLAVAWFALAIVGARSWEAKAYV